MKNAGLFLIAVSALALCSCSGVKKQFDFSKQAPDEFAVVKRAPLEMPADINHLPAPRPGAPRPQEQATDVIARETVLGESSVQFPREAGVSQGESILLQRTGGANATAAIRSQVDQETAKIADEQSPGIDKIRKMIGQKVEAPAKVVDPVAETNRLKQNKAEGKPVTYGKTPTIDED